MTEPIRGAGQPSWPLSPYQIAVSYGTSAPGAAGAHAAASAGIARGGGADWFGPLDPLRPIAPPQVAGRRFDFPPGYNLVTRPRAYEPIGFAELRGFADAYDLLRLVIETRKDQMERQRWCIRPRDPKLNRKNATISADTAARVTAIEILAKARRRHALEDLGGDRDAVAFSVAANDEPGAADPRRAWSVGKRAFGYKRRPNPPRMPPAISEIRNSTIATKNTILAIPTAAPAIPPNPRIAAMIAMIKSVTTRLSMSTLPIGCSGGQLATGQGGSASRAELPTAAQGVRAGTGL